MIDEGCLRSRLWPRLLSFFAITTALALSTQNANAQVGLVDDGQSHPPPATDTYAYNSFVPTNSPGATYVDPVFGTTVRRITSGTDHRPDSIYGRNGVWNADGTRDLHIDKILNVVTGASECSGGNFIGSLPDDRSFDPVDPNVLYYFVSNTIRKITIQGGGSCSDTLFFTAPSTLLELGGEVDWIDNTGRYMVMRYGTEPSVYVYDMQTLTRYSNPISGLYINSNYHVGITPDGKYLVGAGASVPAYTGQCASGDGWGSVALYSWPLDHVNHTIGAANEFWSLVAAHNDYISPSDGHTYAVVSDLGNTNVWLADVSFNAAGKCASVQHQSPNKVLLALTWDDNRHITAVSKGSLRDWAFVSSEDSGSIVDPVDTFNSGTADINGNITPWRARKQEIIAINVLDPSQNRRVAHHRSRNVGTYEYQPKVSVSWCGQYVGWASNFNQNTNPMTVDVYAVQFGGSCTGGGGGGPTRLEENDAAVVYTPTPADWPAVLQSGHSGGRAVERMGAGRATVTFNGTGVKWIGYHDGGSGIARIYLDGVDQGTVDTYSAQGQYQAVLYTISGLSQGSHTLAVEVTGTKNPASSGLWIWVDAFDITP
jgi:hypothetical protein